MVSSEEFYELLQSEQRELVDERRVILDQDPIQEIPEYGAPIRVLNEPLAKTIFKRLQNNRYTVSELAEKIGVRDKHVRNIINKHRHQRFEKLLTEYRAVLRAKDVKGPALVYSLESIPYFARVMDPTLGCSLLGWNDKLAQQFDSTEWIPSGEVTNIDEDYAWIIGDYWDLDSDDTFDYITKFERRYVETALGPLPIVDNDQKYESVQNRLADAKKAYKRRKAIDETTPHKKVNIFEKKSVKGVESISFYQSLSLTLFDLLEYTLHEDPSVYDAVEEQLGIVLEWIGPNSVKQNKVTTSSEADITNTKTIASSEYQEVSASEDEEFDWEERELLIELVALTQELGRLPSKTDINDHTRFSHQAYTKKFGSLMNTFKQAGIITQDPSD